MMPIFLFLLDEGCRMPRKHGDLLEEGAGADCGGGGSCPERAALKKYIVLEGCDIASLGPFNPTRNTTIQVIIYHLPL